MVAAFETSARINREAGGRKKILPFELFGGLGVFFGQGVGEIDRTIAVGEIGFVDLFDGGDLAFEGFVQAVVQRGEAVFSPFTGHDVEGATLEIDIFDPQTETLDTTDATTIHQLGHQLVLGLFDVVEEAADFFFGEDDGNPLRFFGPDGIDPFQGVVENVIVHKDEGTEGLVLGGGSYIFLDGQVGEELFDLGGSHLGGVAFIVEEDKAFAPLDVAFFGTDRVVFEANFLSELIEQF
jgi:hypothetical protein